MKFIILTLFPEAFESYLNVSLLKRALAKKFIKIELKNLRDFGVGAHKVVDLRPYGGGAGMVLRVDIIDRALRAIKAKQKGKKSKVILLTPQGKVFNQKLAKQLSKVDTLILVCGRYEGFDERIRDLVDYEISIGDYVLTGGEIPALAVLDTVARLVPGVVGKAESLVSESFSESAGRRILEYPQYTRPENYKGKRVPKVLLTGNHAKINEWRQKEALKRTKKRRPDLLRGLR
ncbi:MAG: tRNA (guanosine(37)-N1)-methyltransferase TrmD [Candidatus Doudnabacteria bacterium RIFCSPHIGHO2_02_FULL_42_25]|uniref:tRNA (guanine-N(1)-)-methyltransferase n=1 Tax=Candidatus Doudnabacteria bacterium RIFCSPHIGHO2_01_FULL_41_86 TaxID=1817821 RepID=A0A1F5N9A2_9BACT|nr:MAG: tRNA (guanosine(37)-N1)-methyltransferase TrmD [Candidatus Doudnabacteria bacterium RIFCSPHIGHO2_01_FULL_41_86]OGE75784.1 MAG: tRNA (guanosine(37)-N1)-methyltransferase TrmD [Candidatus Doudnabacteria bacterium RIFCSPHIGHO2_01_43_10]OGE86446.1 MAG: tRNA (guanosine(37)-N1)-methyltransferase TrmD [Candidatus Doudnabacteria bacterium RIFCSPHIGHO2_12_FULL_42_22]OGE87445.1 MAG: tRNA (guanosine(37)-N1)-methyltransferase TrmD [Candidatus Doudnabacteria bacterium RIFCSPHIGHO2_02_FULL_42_25]OGE9